MTPSLPPKRFERRFPVPAVKAGDLGLGPGEVVVVEAADVDLIGLWSGAGAVEGVEAAVTAELVVRDSFVELVEYPGFGVVSPESSDFGEKYGSSTAKSS